MPFTQAWPVILFGALLGCSVTIVIVLYIYEHRKRPLDKGCPCLYTTPCSWQCTCINSFSSKGCSRCASYGSIEQRKLRAGFLASKIDKY